MRINNSQWGDLLNRAGAVAGLLALLWATSTQAYLFIVSVIVVLAIVGGLYYRQLPSWTVLHVNYQLGIRDPQGSSAYIKKTINLRANKPGNRDFVHMNITADGEISGFQVDEGRAVVKMHAGKYYVRQILDNDVPHLKTIELTLRYELTNSFPSEEEAFCFDCSHRTKIFSLEVLLPKGKPVKRSWTYCVSAGDRASLHDPEIKRDGARILWELKRPQVGHEYWVNWKW